MLGVERRNHQLVDTLVGHPYAERLKPNDHSMLVNMTKSLVKSTNILLTLKDNNKETQ